MTPNEILAELETLATRLGLVVRFDAFDAKLASKGGLCRVHGSPFVVIDGGAPIMDKIGVLSEALAMFDLEAIYVPPILRTRLARRRTVPAPRKPTRQGSSNAPVRPPLRPVAKASRRASG